MPPPQDHARVVLLIVLLLWLTSAPDAGPGIVAAPAILASRLERQRAAHRVLNSTKWGDFSPTTPADGGAKKYLNVTGFREEDGYAWADLGHFRERCLEWSRSAFPAVVGSDAGDGSWDLGRARPTWRNATGIVHGEWVRREGSEKRKSRDYNLTQMAPTILWTGHEFNRNITGAEGKMLLRVEDKHRSVQVQDDGAGAGGDQASTGGLVREVSALASIEDVLGTGSTFDVRLHGVHWPEQGAMLLTTTSDKFGGIFGLPHLTPGPNFFRSSQKLLNETTGEVLLRKEKARFGDLSNPWSSYPNMPHETWNPSPHCELVMFVQVHPLETDPLAAMVGLIEDELRFPTGAPVPATPDLKMSTVIYSPDCAFFLESKGPPDFTPADGKHLVGMKDEVYAHSAKLWLVTLAAVMFAQVHLLKTQMRESSTPSTLGRVSFWTAGIMVLADGIVFGAASFWSLSASATLLPSLLLTFAGFISMTIGGSFLYEVYKVQEPERRNREREQTAANTAPTAREAAARAATARAAAAAAAAVVAAPVPVVETPTPRPPSPPIIIPSDQDIDAEIFEMENAGPNASLLPTTAPGSNTTGGVNTATSQQQPTPFSAILGRFVLFGLMLLFLSLAATSWWAWARSAYANMLSFAYLSLWVPQIARNVARNSRRAFAWRFTIGQSALRLLPVAYFYLRERNIAFARPDWNAFLILAGWLWCQIWVLGFQDVLGPRFGVPKGWAPEAWDYHPILREDNLEAGGLPMGLMGSGGGSASEPGSPVAGRRRSSVGGGDKDKDGGSKHTRMRGVDCAICREVLEVPVIRAGHSDPAAGGVAGVLARRQYMVTPCRHIFHSECLEGWLRFRLQCPICREDLPPL
ncbi:hypothetical protein GGTG_00501 [Gaeumannomyces tritici R3-111a-1]|uniref:DSC E3 ubiquitin ligase complex subunit A n=1 Tax=Gaeumannomyces tritici (strain R3-111a-1) TaxID=644352 RepID=J3NGW5_GAET3|nr:hypothetical protein GGTG_00501 [Gaeumannomyces tritici R3-111a-1]EJT80505.1 hypothetical protein GGTG_00501 [Gaeumannomyces tritici R3-111a-1]